MIKGHRIGLALALTSLWALQGVPTTDADSLSSRSDAQLTLLHLADVYSMSPVSGGEVGGLARVAALKKSLQEAGQHVVVTLGGDFLSPSVASSIFQGEQMVAGLGAAGLDIATLGNHEFDFGPGLLRQRMREAPWEWVVSNVLDDATGEPFGGAKDHLVRTYGDLTVGYFGLCITGEEISRENRHGVTFLDPMETAAKYVALLEGKGVDVIVAITHLDYAYDVALAERFPQIDLILGGHEHFAINSLVGNALITKPGSDARNATRIDVSRPRPDAPLEKHFELIPITPAIEDDPETAALVAQWEGRLEGELDIVVGTTAVPLDAVAESVRSGESNLGNFIADAMLAETAAEIAILNGGSIRSNRVYPAGELTRRSLVAIHPFGGTICAVELSGDAILRALNHGVARLEEVVGRFPQVGGMRFRIDPERPPGDRVLDVMVGDAPLDPEHDYQVAIVDYVLEGGDGYAMFSEGRVLIGPEEGSLLVTALEEAVRARGEIRPRVEGRIQLPGTVHRAAAQRRAILDTDLGIDGVIGMLYLLKAPEVEVAAITLVHGITDRRPAGANAVRILELTGHTSIPVAFGSRRPLEGYRAFPSFWREQANELGGARLPHTTRAAGKKGVDLMISTLEQSAEPMTIIAMGPLTNVAAALRRRPDLLPKIAEIAVMGGAVNVRGNVGNPYVGIRNNAAEWNFYLDPHAAREVLDSGARIRLMPLDATQSLPVTPEFVDRIRGRPRDQTSELLLALLEAVRDGIEAGWYYFWDSLAAVATARTDILACAEERIEVVTQAGSRLGQTRPAPGGAEVCVVEEINREAFEDHLVEAIFR